MQMCSYKIGWRQIKMMRNKDMWILNKNKNVGYAFFVVAMVYVPIARRAFGHTILLKILGWTKKLGRAHFGSLCL
jgi:hypothetical protein